MSNSLNIHYFDDAFKAYEVILNLTKPSEEANIKVASNIKNYFVMIGRKSKYFDERVGYFGEQVVLLAQIFELNPYWLGLSYHMFREVYYVDKDEKFVSIIALGNGETQGVPQKIMSIEDNRVRHMLKSFLYFTKWQKTFFLILV